MSMLVEDELRDAGAVVVGPVPTVERGAAAGRGGGGRWRDQRRGARHQPAGASGGAGGRPAGRARRAVPVRHGLRRGPRHGRARDRADPAQAVRAGKADRCRRGPCIRPDRHRLAAPTQAQRDASRLSFGFHCQRSTGCTSGRAASNWTALIDSRVRSLASDLLESCA